MASTRFFAAIWVLMFAACYTYDPAELSEVRPEMRVRARLSAEEAARLGSIVPTAGRVIQGEVIERNGDGVLLLVPVTSNVVGTRVEVLQQRLRIPDGGIVELETRRLDRLKTGLVLGAGAALVGGIATAALTGGFKSDRPGSGGGPAELWIPIGFSLRLGR